MKLEGGKKGGKEGGLKLEGGKKGGKKGGLKMEEWERWWTEVGRW